MATSERILMPEHILGPQEVIHPCLDWVKGRLIVGANLQGGGSAVLSSDRGLVKLDGMGPVCEQGKKFKGAVSPEVANEFLEYLAEEKEPEDGGKLLSDLSRYVGSFVIFPTPWLPDVLSAWILGTYLFPVFQTYPYVWITSKEPGCGKSLLGGIIASLSFNGEFMVAPTEAQLFHLSETSRGVQVWDEVENQEEMDQKRFNAMRPVLLNGYRNGGVVPRQTGKHFEKSAKYHVFCPRVLIGLTKLPATAQQRSISVRLVKRNEEQKAKHYVHAEQAKEECSVRERCLLWALENVDQVNKFYQDEKLRTELEHLLGAGRISDDIWLPLYALACAAKASDCCSVETLKMAAVELAKAGSPGQVVVPSITEQSKPAEEANEGIDERQIESMAVVTAAINRLEFCGPITPQALAEDVSQISGRTIAAQTLSKRLGELGIRSKKQNGRRVFAPSADERQCALQNLSSNAGQQGHEDNVSGELGVPI